MEVLQDYAPSSSLSSSCPFTIDVEHWLIAEQKTLEILCTIQPNVVSEQRRKEIIDYIHRIILDYCGTEVFPFGSVPLKTYLPDGDIDLTALSDPNAEEDLARDICNILESEAQKDAEFQILGIQFIRAQVKILKCTVQNIAVDISFNQMAGIYALCFLEQADQLIGKDHLFKRSVILIKAWCYYESRILGAHHGLLSTYALETLVLHVINRFHQSICGPLTVLYRFLNYYSAFDWNSYCVSLNGPVAISSLPAVVTLMPEHGGDELLLGEEYLKSCRDLFLVPLMAPEGERAPQFPIKYLNILDPLKDNNNLGRSVSKGNFHRIRCALTYGAQNLEKILMLPGEGMVEELKKFFVNTLERNGKGRRADVETSVPVFGAGMLEISDLCGDYDSYFSGLELVEWNHDFILPPFVHHSHPSPFSQVGKRSASDVHWHLGQLNSYGFSNNNRDGLYVKKMAKSHGTGAYFPNWSAEEIKLQKTGSYIPSIVLKEKESQGTVTNVPDVGVEEMAISQGIATGVEGTTDSQRLGTFVPHKVQRTRNPESSHHGLRLKSAQNDDCALGMGNGGSGSGLNLSLAEFPLLSAAKKPSSSKIPAPSQPSVTSSSKIPASSQPIVTSSWKIPASGQKSVKTLHVKDLPSSLEDIEFGTLGFLPPLLKLPSQQESKKPNSGSIAATTIQGPKELPSKSSEEIVHVQRYELKDSKDFPPLSRPKTF